MNKRLLFDIICVIAIVIAGIDTAVAFPTKNYATTSKLNKGRWIKIAIPEDGMYEITFDELRLMGFAQPQKVTIWGTGGHPISEILDGQTTDDLKQVPYKTGNNKIYFYACGPVQYSADTPTTTPHYVRKINSCATAGYYFITDNDEETPIQPSTITYGITGSNVRSTSLDYFHHEVEEISMSQSGKDFIGEKMTDNVITIPYSLPMLCQDSAIIVNPCAVCKSESISYVNAQVNGESLVFDTSKSKIFSSKNEYVFYNYAAPFTSFRSETGNMPSEGDVTISILTSGEIIWSRLDYCIITYYHNNVLTRAPHNQLRMGFEKVSSADIIALEGNVTNKQIWNIDNPQNPKNYTINQKDGINGFTPLYTIDFTQFIAFDPTKELKKITDYEVVENQNIHGMPVPDMVIVTCEDLMPQAERVAQMHRDNDNMVVHVVDQQKIFNEFSSGTPDVMAIRLMNKMFYDRDTSGKFKYLLMFGGGSYDNRQLLSKNPCHILTYESIVSNDENNSYVSDDFFGFLDDNSGANPPGELLRQGVGLIPSASVEEAESDVEKLLNYVNNPDFGPWRNNALFVADYTYGVPGNPSYEYWLHESQAEGIVDLITNELNIGFATNKVYVNQFPKDPATGFLLEGRKSMSTLLEDGQFYMTYVGHASPSYLTKEVRLWTSNETRKASNQHLPIITTACCDVARYDGNKQRGLMEIFFHNPNGGAIAMLTATRAAYASGNDALNQAFTRNLFCYNTTGHMPTLGEAYKNCKLSFGTVTATNKMMFSLLGDPAMKVYYPKPLFKITKINGKTVGNANISSGALQQVTVEAQVLTENGSEVDATFSGDATLTIYDYLRRETTWNGRDIFYPRQLLTSVNGRVENGIFTGKAILPRHSLNPGSTGLVMVYAHRDNSNDMVSGSSNKIVIGKYSPTNSLTVDDNTPPTINAIYFNDKQEFEVCNTVAPSSTLFITASDDFAFNNQSSPIGNSMDIKIDGGKTSIYNVKAYATLSDEGKSLNVEMPMELEPGDHTLKFTVYDIAGNMTSHTLNFSVSNTQQPQLTVEQEPAVDKATFHFKSDLNFTPSVLIKVFDSKGYLVWKKTTSDFPFDWDLTISGKRMPAGVYTFFGRFNNGTTYGGTTTGTLIVADEQNMQ